jgi:HPt (histidine-containing phosphotransfer) domain-containing protein
MDHVDANAAYAEFLPYADVKEGLGRVVGSKDLYRRLLRSFKDGGQMDDLSAKLRKDDLDAIDQAAHKLKGTTANLGLKKLYEAAIEIEKSVKTGKIPEDISGFEDAAEKTADVIGRLIEIL